MASPPENERKGGEEDPEAHDKCEKIAATWEAAMLGIVVGIEKTLFFNDVEVVLPGAPRGLAVVRGAALAGPREARGGRLTGVSAQGRVRVGMGW